MRNLKCIKCGAPLMKGSLNEISEYCNKCEASMAREKNPFSIDANGVVHKKDNTTIERTLADRGMKYGPFESHAKITQDIKRAMMASPNYIHLSDDKREALDMIAHKIGRIINGNPNYHDSWHDIIGYTKLVADKLHP